MTAPSPVMTRREQVTRTVRWDWDIDRAADAGPVPDMPGHTSSGKPVTVRPEGVQVLFEQSGGGTARIGVTVSGYTVKRDGTASLIWGSVSYPDGAASLPLMPQWLASLVLPEIVMEVTVAAGTTAADRHGYAP
jgi:hypothetical protein